MLVIVEADLWYQTEPVSNFQSLSEDFSTQLMVLVIAS